MIDEIKISPLDTIRLILPEHLKELELSLINIENYISKKNNKEEFRIDSKKDASEFDKDLGVFVGKYRTMIDLSKIKDNIFSEQKGYDKFSNKATRSIRLLTNCIYQYNISEALPLDILYDKYPDFNEFRYFLDTKINFANCSARAYELLACHYENKALNERDTTYTSYSTRLKTQYVAQALVIGLRALWDKIMNIIVLEEYGIKELENLIIIRAQKKDILVKII